MDVTRTFTRLVELFRLAYLTAAEYAEFMELMLKYRTKRELEYEEVITLIRKEIERARNSELNSECVELGPSRIRVANRS